MITTYTLHDDWDADEGKGPDLQVKVSDEDFAYGLELTISREGTPLRVVLLDYFHGKLVVRNFRPEDDETLDTMHLLTVRADSKEENN